MKPLGSSTFNARTSINYGFEGNTGPAGPTGPTGPVNTLGQTGPAGNGVFWITKINSDGITVQLLNGTLVTVTGISGNTPTDFSAVIANTPYGITGATATASDAFFIGAGVVGLTATFKPLKAGLGISLTYNSNNLVFTGVTLSNYALGPTGSVLYALGNTATPAIDINTLPVFLYETVTVGITTQDLASVVFSSFLQAKSASGVTNINTINSSSISTWINNINESTTNAFHLTGNTWSSKQIYKTGFSKIDKTAYDTGVTWINSDLFNVTNTSSFGNHEYGSCCYCATEGNSCIDYVRRSYCVDTLGGVFSKTSCSGRRTLDCSTLGACCINGRCVDTTRTICEQYGGTFHYQHSCASGTSPC